jgi:LysR family glycine cleavage system transcriptional activator
MALEAARAGRGIALVPAVVLPDLEHRRQLQILDFALTPSAGTYHVLTANAQSANPALRSFVAWLESEAATLRSRTRRLLQQAHGGRKASGADRAA